jgi:hypothetical protein
MSEKTTKLHIPDDSIEERLYTDENELLYRHWGHAKGRDCQARGLEDQRRGEPFRLEVKDLSVCFADGLFRSASSNRSI